MLAMSVFGSNLLRVYCIFVSVTSPLCPLLNYSLHIEVVHNIIVAEVLAVLK